MTRGGIVGGRRGGRQAGRARTGGTGQDRRMEDGMKRALCLPCVALALPALPAASRRACPRRSACPSCPDRPRRPSRSKPNGRLFAPQDLGLLEAPDREQWQKPDQIMDALGIAEGSVVAELGAGGGWFTLQLARAGRTERPRLRRGHPAGDARGDQPARAAREPHERPDGARHARATRICRPGSTPC